MHVREGYSPSGGHCGAVETLSGCLPPPEKKFKGFRELVRPDGKPRLVVRVDGASKAVDPVSIDQYRKYDFRTRSRCLLVGPCVAGVTPFVTSLNLYNAVKAILGRVFRAPAHQPVATAWAVVRRFDDFLLNGLLEKTIAPLSIDDWIAGCPPRRQKAFARAKVELLDRGWDPDWRWFSSFIKSEKLFGAAQDEDGLSELRTMMDRLIQAPHDCTHLIAGPLLRPLTKALKGCWNRHSHIFYAAVSVEELNMWFNDNYRPGAYAVMCDYSMFDNSHSQLSWEWVESIYRRMGLFEMDVRFGKVMDSWREPWGRMTGMGWMVTYVAYVMNASGRDDTALANALLNGAVMFICLAALFADKAVEALTLKDLLWAVENVRLSVCGDDSLALVPFLPCDAEVVRMRLSGLLACFGFDAGADKMKISDKPFDMVYLAMRPHPSGSKWYFAKTIGRALWKLGWRLDFESGDQEAWMAGNMLQVLHSQAIVPILSDVARSYMAYHGRRTVRKFEPDPNRPWEWGVQTPDYDMRVVSFLAEGYGVFQCEMLDCIKYVSQTIRFPCVLDHPVLDRMLCVDEM